MDTSIINFVLSANYIKEGRIYRIYFECRDGNLELSVNSDAGRHFWKRESIFTDTFTVEGYLEDFFSEHGGRIEYHGKSSLEEDIKRMIMAYGNSSIGYCWRTSEQNNYGVFEVGGNNSIADIITNSYRDMMNGAVMRTFEQLVREEITEEGEEDETRR